MIWIVSGDFVVDGVLSVRGIDGESVMTLNSAHIPALSGPGGPAAGNGGQGSPSRTGQDPLGEPGFGPFQVPGGGGGGGALAILALGRIIVGATGRIVADGGNGGGGEAAGGNTHGAGGGGGSGGMLLLYAQNEIQLQVHGETYANRDYDFVLSADGGIGTQGRYGGPEFLAKYPPPSAGAIWDWNPSGGFGGLGLVQLFARPGANADGTNTHLDDNVRLFHGTTELVGREKQRYLAWRGFPNAQNVLVDDFGQPTHVGDNEGDIRPTPILLPILP